MNIYLIQQAGSDLYKIGISKHTKKRLKEHQTGNGNPLQIITNVECKFPYKVETSLHNLWSFKHTIGEWFELTNEDVANFETYCRTIDNQMKILKENNTWVQNTNWL
jgi:hypothetical protein